MSDGVSPAWPIDYETLEPFYERAERLYHVRGQHGVDPTEVPRGPFPYAPVPHSAGMANIVSELRAMGLHPSPLPLGLLRPGEPDGCVLCNTCNSFPCKVHAKSDADVCCVRHAIQRPNVTLVDQRLRAPADHRRRRGGTSRRSKSSGTARRFESRRRCSSCRAARSTRRRCCCDRPTTRIPNGLANSSGLVGTRYMAHLATMMQGFHPFRRNETVFQKTVAINDFYLRGPARRTRSDRFSRRDGRTASWRRPSCRGSRCGRTTRGCRAAWTGWRSPRIFPGSRTA